MISLRHLALAAAFTLTAHAEKWDEMDYGRFLSATYANAEARLLTYKWQNVWLQNIVFVDGGAAGASWGDAFRDTRGSAGTRHREQRVPGP